MIFWLVLFPLYTTKISYVQDVTKGFCYNDNRISMIGVSPIMLILLFLIEKNFLHNLMNAYKFCRVQSSVSRKMAYAIGHRHFTRNQNPTKKAQIWLRMDFCNYLLRAGFPAKEQMKSLCYKVRVGHLRSLAIDWDLVIRHTLWHGFFRSLFIRSYFPCIEPVCNRAMVAYLQIF